jgi:hypothetical protein
VQLQERKEDRSWEWSQRLPESSRVFQRTRRPPHRESRKLLVMRVIGVTARPEGATPQERAAETLARRVIEGYSKTRDKPILRGSRTTGEESYRVASKTRQANSHRSSRTTG